MLEQRANFSFALQAITSPRLTQHRALPVLLVCVCRRLIARLTRVQGDMDPTPEWQIHARASALLTVIAQAEQELRFLAVKAPVPWAVQHAIATQDTLGQAARRVGMAVTRPWSDQRHALHARQTQSHLL